MACSISPDWWRAMACLRRSSGDWASIRKEKKRAGISLRITALIISLNTLASGRAGRPTALELELGFHLDDAVALLRRDVAEQRRIEHTGGAVEAEVEVA